MEINEGRKASERKIDGPLDMHHAGEEGSKATQPGIICPLSPFWSRRGATKLTSPAVLIEDSCSILSNILKGRNFCKLHSLHQMHS